MGAVLPLVILAAVFILIAVRQVGSFRLQIWQIMLGGAIAVLLTGQIGWWSALHAINVDVIIFLFCMFVIGQALEQSGYLSHLAYRLFRNAKTADALVLTILFGMGLGSALLMNDTLAIVGTPVMLLLSRKHRISPKVLLLALAFSITIGSVMSPIGNPQNLLIALNGKVANPFMVFLKYLFLPTVINLFIAYVVLKLFFKEHFHSDALTHESEPIRDAKLARMAKLSLLLLLALIFVKIGAVFFGVDIRMTYLAIIAALPIILFSASRWDVVRNIDWSTLVFFAAMFVLMESVWESGVMQSLIAGLQITALPMILGISVLASQLISNVPLVALYLPTLVSAGVGVSGLMALAAGSTIAGNLLILGAASNVIIIQNAESRGETITFWEFAKVGVPLTIVNVLVYWLFLTFV
jgi:Na+/H+ antiporter NhaD/arsenite permease-like protein